MLENFVRLVHATEYLYSVPARDVVLDIETDSLTSSVIEENQPLMTDCVTPRTLSKLIADCSRGNIPGARLNIELVLRTIQSLDQAGSTHNLTLAHQVRMLLDIGTDGIVPSITEGGVAVTEFIDLDDEGSVELDDLELTKAITPSNSGSTDSTDSTGDSGSAGDSNSAGDSGSTNSAGDSGSAKIFLGLSQRAIKAIFADRLY
jgi:hypothetical protein